MTKPLGPVFDRTWRLACRVGPIGRQDIARMVAKHYLRKRPAVAVCELGLFRGEQAIGCAIFALPPRETSKRYGGETWELARVWVDDLAPTNAETFLISKALRFVRANYPSVVGIVSYADPSAGHSGVIYRAGNWQEDGCTDEGRKTPRCDYADAATGKVFSRRSHIPAGVEIKRIPRVSKRRFYYRLRAA